MEKRVFEAPEMSVTLFDESDILTNSPGGINVEDNGNIDNVPW